MVSALKEENLYDKTAYPERIGKAVRRAVSSERATKDIDLDGAFGIIGERINPTGKKALQAELREGCLDIVTDMAEAQEAAGAINS